MIGLEEGEKIILEARKHWFVIFSQGFFVFLVALIPFGIAFLVVKFFPQFKEINFPGDPLYLFFFFYFLWVLGCWIAFFVMWTDYYLDVWRVTPKRIIAVEQKGLFRREIINLRYEKVQDATVEIAGIIPTLLNFGDIHVQTAGVGREIILRTASHPQKVKKTILDFHSKVLEREVGEP